MMCHVVFETIGVLVTLCTPSDLTRKGAVRGIFRGTLNFIGCIQLFERVCVHFVVLEAYENIIINLSLLAKPHRLHSYIFCHSSVQGIDASA